MGLITEKTSKVLLPLNERPLIIYIINWLSRNGISNLVLNLHHFGDRIVSLLGDGSDFGVSISYSYEPTLLGTAGAIKNNEVFFKNTFVVAYGDVLTDFSLRDMIRSHEEIGNVVTLALSETNTPWDVGIVEMDSEKRIRSFIEKPPRGSENSNLCNSGVYVLDKRIFDYIPEIYPSDFAYDIFPKLIEFNVPIGGYVLADRDYVQDIGTIEKYRKAIEDVRIGKVKIVFAQ